MKVIEKYPLYFRGGIEIIWMPAGGNILSIQFEESTKRIYLYAAIDNENPLCPRSICLLATGQEAWKLIEGFKYVGSVQAGEPWHAFIEDRGIGESPSVWPPNYNRLFSEVSNSPRPKFTQTLTPGDKIRPKAGTKLYSQFLSKLFKDPVATTTIIAMHPDGFDTYEGPYGMQEHSDDWELIKKGNR